MKGQVSIEFFVYFTISLLILAVLFSSVADRQVEAFEFRENSLASNIGSSYAYELEQAENYGTGYERDFELPREIFGTPYNVTVDSGFVIVEWKDEDIVQSTRIASVNTEEDVKIRASNGPFRVKNNGSIHVIPQ
ncbi:MAG: hypothetical protein R6V35_00580 [Candidatus Nanohaloarchaea archaeon]